MPMVPDARFEAPLLHHAFDCSQYPPFKISKTKMSIMPRGRGHHVRGHILVSYSSRRSPSLGAETCKRSRNISEPLIPSANCMRESWSTTLVSAHTVGDIANLLSDDDICTAVQRSRRITVVREGPDIQPLHGVDGGHLEKTSNSSGQGYYDLSGHVEQSDCKDEVDSLYSTDSADEDAHPLLLSMPVIPQIKLERKATIRNPSPNPLSDLMQNPDFLSPRIRDLRTPARTSSRRYGRVLPRANPQEVLFDAHPTKRDEDDQVALALQVPRPLGTTNCSYNVENRTIELACVRSASEPMLNSPCTLDDEDESLSKKGTDEFPHSDVLLSMIDEANTPLGPHNSTAQADVDDPRVLPKRSKCSHGRSSMSLSISFSNVVQVVADGCASLDLLRKLKSTTRPKSDGPLPNTHDPTPKWAPKQGKIIIKVFVPSTDDIWMFRVPQEINLADFTSKVAAKLKLAVSFSGSLWDEPKYYFATDERFSAWVKGRIRFGRNLPIVAHIHPHPPLVRLNMDGDGSKVW